MGVAAACELGATPLDRPFGLADGHVHTAERALEAERHLAAASADHRLPGIGKAESHLLDPSIPVALRCQHVKSREPGMVEGAGGLDELLAPGYRLIIQDQNAEEHRVGGDGRSVKVAVVSGPAKRRAQIGALDAE